ncbi:MAG: aminotransferase class III-fold pyridoxal phosphate-dependent enzyme, partial [Hyphomicrobiaceae bacterium]|nr:aminotransferase class III-fold pyridoxal phosphate-dependent enzyme [Hyphomicrobiaceae bacterium]
MAVGNAVLDEVTAPGFLDAVRQKGLRIKQMLGQLHDEHPKVVEEVRSSGLLTGLKVKPPAGDVVKALIDEKLLTVPAGDNVVRFLPPLIVSESELAEAMTRASRAFKKLA